jgi:putative DNA primase/helicase
LDALVVTFRRFLAVPEGAAETLALWVVFTHAIEASAVAPRLAILSPLPRCGKTTLLGLLIRLVPRPLPTSNVTPAVVYRVIARDDPPTLLIDEADTFFGARPELLGIVNSGHSRDTAFVDRCDGDNHEPKRFLITDYPQP